MTNHFEQHWYTEHTMVLGAQTTPLIDAEGVLQVVTYFSNCDYGDIDNMVPYTYGICCSECFVLKTM